MACTMICSDTAVFAVWGQPLLSDIERVLEELRARSKRLGRPVTYVTRIPSDSPPPDADVRRRLDELMPAVVECCSSYHVVLEGMGFVAAVKRGMLLSLFQIRWRGRTFFVHATPAQIFAHLQDSERAAVTQVLELARKDGLLEGSGPRSLPAPPAKHASLGR